MPTVTAEEVAPNGFVLNWAWHPNSIQAVADLGYTQPTMRPAARPFRRRCLTKRAPLMPPALH